MLETHRSAKRDLEEKHENRMAEMSRQLSSAELAIPEHNEIGMSPFFFLSFFPLSVFANHLYI